jgi:hypothetical protein
MPTDLWERWVTTGLQWAWVAGVALVGPTLLLGWYGPGAPFLTWSAVAFPLYLGTWAWRWRRAWRSGLPELLAVTVPWLGLAGALLRLQYAPDVAPWLALALSLVAILLALGGSVRMIRAAAEPPAHSGGPHA